MDAKAAHNIADVLEHGPRLSYNRYHWVGGVRGSGGNEEVLVCGLGGMGVGTMWSRTTDEHRRDPRYALAKDGWWFSFWHGWRKQMDIGGLVNRDWAGEPPTKEEATIVMSAYLRTVVGPNKRWTVVLTDPEIEEVNSEDR